MEQLPPRMSFAIDCNITVETFMYWIVGTLRPFRIGTKRRGRTCWAKHLIPAPYDRVLAQLVAEDDHADGDESHEAARRRSYARQVLENFAKEFRLYTGPPIDFRSKVLTPILQRQLFGVSDVYFPPLNAVIAKGPNCPTIGQATLYYLGQDPADPGLIPTYRFNMVFIPHIRWHLGTIMGIIQIGDGTAYDRVMGTNQDNLMSAIRPNHNHTDDGTREDVFNAPMATVLKAESLQTFFSIELEQMVRTFAPGSKWSH